MASKRKPAQIASGEGADPAYDQVLAGLVGLLEDARRAAARSVNAVMTATYWEIGRRIVEEEQGGAERATYAKGVVKRLAKDLTSRFGRGFGQSNLFLMRGFYLAYPEIFQTMSGKFDLETAAQHFPLPWSAYTRLLSVDDPQARAFYEAEALRGGWTVRQLARQIGSQFYERALLSKNKAAMLTKAAIAKPQDEVRPEEQVRDPFVLEFLDLKDEYSESDLEEALIRHLEAFLLELGGDFTFVGRQKRLRIGNAWYRVDLVFFHRRLRCLVLVDLKLEALNHADVGQMHLYCNYARKHWTHDDENPPVGLILCAGKDAALAEYALDGLPNKILAAEYRTALPDPDVLQAELERTRLQLEARLQPPPSDDSERNS